MSIIKIDNSKSIPIYLQIIDSIIDSIKDKTIESGDKLPSINEIVTENGIAKETVVKSFKILQQKGIVKSIRGKGFYIASDNIEIRQNVFVMLDNLSAYKATLLKSIKDGLSDKANIDYYFHHYNPRQFERIIKENLGQYTHYVISVFENPVCLNILKEIPADKLFVLDILPEDSGTIQYKGVIQDHANDLFTILSNIEDQISVYKKFHLIFRDSYTQPPFSLMRSFKDFCELKKISYSIMNECPDSLEKGDAFIVIDDDDLVKLITILESGNLKMGTDVGILSYNETTLKKVISTGISTISTDFDLMGKQLSALILENKSILISNPCKFNNRGSF
jgi:DNA-binding transcriptional regulator YhcF (GntR family)